VLSVFGDDVASGAADGTRVTPPSILLSDIDRAGGGGEGVAGVERGEYAEWDEVCSTTKPLAWAAEECG
jgi:hypothetical protein